MKTINEVIEFLKNNVSTSRGFNENESSNDLTIFGEFVKNKKARVEGIITLTTVTHNDDTVQAWVNFSVVGFPIITEETTENECSIDDLLDLFEKTLNAKNYELSKVAMIKTNHTATIDI